MKIYKRILLITLAVMLIVCFAFTPIAYAATAKTMTYSEYKTKYTQFINDSRWKHGVSWSISHKPEIYQTKYGTGCLAYAEDFAAYVYGVDGSSLTKMMESYAISSTSANDIKTGDIVYFSAPSRIHWFVVLERNGSKIYAAQGNMSSLTDINDTEYTIVDGKLYDVYASQDATGKWVNGAVTIEAIYRCADITYGIDSPVEPTTSVTEPTTGDNTEGTADTFANLISMFMKYASLFVAFIISVFKLISKVA